MRPLNVLKEKDNPRRQARRQALLEAAYALFADKGYEATSLHDIVARAGGSLATLYELFGGKPGLMRALIEHRSHAITEIFDRAPADSLKPHQVLSEFARRLIGLCTGDDCVLMFRLLIGEGASAPELAPLFFASGPDAGKQKVAGYLAQLNRQGVLKIADTDRAARQFCGMVTADYQMRTIAGLKVDLSAKEVARHVDSCVGAFMRAYAP